MNFAKETNVKGAFIPHSALKVSGFRDNEEATLRTLPSTLILTRRHMTAKDLVQTIESLTQTAAELTTELLRACGPCEECQGEGCPYADAGDEPISLPDYLREEAGISPNAKLCAEVNEAEKTVMIYATDHKHDLSDVPEGQLEMLVEHGICLGALEEKLMSGGVLYHG